MGTAKAKPKLKPRGKPFQPGNTGGPGRGKKLPLREAGSKLLADLERAYSTPETPGEPPGIKKAREMIHGNYEKFLTLYARLAGSGTQTPEAIEEVAAAAIVGPKEEAIEELANRLLHEWEIGDEGKPGVGTADP